MIMSRRARLSVLISIAIATRGSLATDPPPIRPGTAPIEHVTVKLAQVDVVVRDRSGKFVSGLGPADFKVLEDGTPLEVVAVDEWGRETLVAPPTRVVAQPPPSPEPSPIAPSITPAPPAEPERRSFVIVFDALGESTALRMNQAKRAASEFVRDRFRPGDVGAVYQLDLTTRAMSGVTSDRGELMRAVEKVAWMPASSLADQVNESVLAYEGMGNHDVAVQRLKEQSAGVAGQLDWQREHVYSSLTDLASIFQGMPGKRTLVLASPGFPMNTTSDQRLQTGGFTPKFQQLVKTMATYGVTVYSIDLGSDLTMGDASQAIDWRVAVGKLGMDENILSDLGLERTLGTNSASSRRQFLGVVAAETGGRMLTDTNIARSFTTIDEESSHFYRISCRVSVTSGVERYRGFKISVSRDGATVTARRGRYSDVTPFERAATGAPETAKSVDSLEGYRRLGARGTAVPLPAGGAERIPIAVVLEAIGPVELGVKPEGAASLDLDIRIVARVADDVVGRYERGFTAVLKKGPGAVRNGFRVEGRLALPPGIYELQGTIRLATPPQLATWTGSLAVPPQSKGTSPVLAGPMMILEDDAAVPLLSQPDPVPGDPLSVKAGSRFLPSTATEFTLGESILAMFWMGGFTSPDAPTAEFSVNFIGSAGTPVEAPSTLVYYGPSSGGLLSALVRLDTSKLQPGTYFVQVSAKPPGATTPVTRRTVPFIFRPRDAAPSAATSSSGL